MRYLFIFLLFECTISASAYQTPPRFPFGKLNSFTTDACTKFPDGTREEPKLWQHCCVAHDIKYWAGGTSALRLQADYELRACVAATGKLDIAEVMFLGVRVGGSPFYPTPWRWGYGWEQIRGYNELTSNEAFEVARRIPYNIYSVPITKDQGDYKY